jgi:carbamoyltransferase
MDVARSLQQVLEQILLKKVDYLHQQTGYRNLCLAGGVALNCVANRRILADGPFGLKQADEAPFDQDEET